MKRLRVLHIEDSEHDAALIDRALLTGGYELFTERVENAEAMSAELNAKVWDVILCNYSMAHFDALSALAVLKSSGLDIPCIIISGTIGEETAVRAMVAGASDYLMKDNLARLVPAIEREMHDAENRRAQEAAENALRHSEEQLTALMNSVDGILWEADAQTFQFTFVSPGAERLLGYPLRRWTEEPTFWTDHIHPDDREEAVRYCAECTRDNRDHEFEYRMLAADGSVVWLCDIVTVLMGDGRAKTLSGIMVNITERKQVEGELASSEARLRLALHAARLGTYDWDVPNDHIEWSRWHEELWGYAPGEFNGTYKTFSDRVHPDDLPEINVKVEQSIATRGRFSHEFRVVWPDNSVHWIAGNGEFEFDGGGKPIRMLGAVMDITERKRAEAELSKSREHLALAQKVAKLGSWEMDLSTMELIWSEETSRIFESDFDSFQPTYRGFLKFVHPDDRAAVDKVFFDSFAQHSNCSIKHRLLMPDGRIKFIEEQWQILRDADDIPVTAVGTCHDITTRTLAEASQQESEDRLRLLFEQMKDGFYYSTPDGQLLDINPAMIEMFGYSSRDEMLKVNVTRDLYFSPEDRKSRTLDDGKDESEVYQMRRKNGSAIWVEDRGQYKYDEEGNIAFHQGILRDVTERKMAEARIRAFATLAQKLSGAVTRLDAGRIIAETAKQLLTWDACNLDLYDAERDLLDPMLNVDLIDGKPVDVTSRTPSRPLSARDQRVIEFGAELTLREDPIQFDKGAVPFGDMVRPSASIMTVPIRNASKVIGLLSIHSYTPRAYDAEALSHLQSLADYCGEAINRIQTEQALEQSEERYRDLVENAHDMIYTRDMDGNLTSINAAGEKLTGYSREEFLQRNLSQIVVPEHLDKAKEKIAQKLAGIEGTSYETDIFGKDGRRITLEVNTTLMYRAGVAVGVQGIARDITERKRIENQLIESESHKGAILESALDCIIAINSQGAVTEFNPAAETVFGYSRADAIGKELADLMIPPAMRDQHRRGMEHYLATGEGPLIGKRIETSAMRSDGSEFPVELAINAVELSGSTVFTAFLRDISERKLAEASLIQSQQRYRDLVENAHDIIYSHDLEGNYTSVNAACEQITGYTAEEALSMSFADIIAPGQLENAKEWIALKIRGGNVNAYEQEIIAKDGRLITIEINTKLVSKDGVPVGIQGIARDVTERKAVREQLEQSAALLRIAGKAAHLGGWSIELPERTLTWSDENCIIHDVLPGYIPTLEEGIASYYPENRGEVLGYVNNCAENGTPYDFEFPIITAKGRHIWVRSIGEAVRDTDGKIIRLQGAIQDITDRKMAEESLRQKDSLIRMAGKLTLTGGWAIKVPENQLFWSDAIFDILEFPRGEIPDLATALELYPQPDRDRVIAGLDACSKDGIPLDIEVEIFTGTGRRIWVRVVAEADRERDGVITRMQGAFQDISERKHTEDQLRQSQKMEAVGQMAGGIAHDFNNMLTAINGYSDLTLRRIPKNDPMRPNIVEIKKAGVRSAELTHQLLAFSRQQILKPKVLHIDQVIGDTGKMLERLIGENIQLVTILNPKVGQVKVDPGQLSQIITNLAVNARDAMPDGGKLTIETRNAFLDPDYARQLLGVLPGSYVVLSVSDTGTGMTADLQEKIFEPFFTTKEVGKGTGLGLATVYGIVKQSGGEIFVYSEVGHGTTFKIYLPRVTEKLEIVEAGADLKTEFPAGSETILLVEDEDLVRSLSHQILETCGYTVIEARDGLEALEIMKKAEIPIDLLFTDVVMPRMGGRELAENLLAEMPNLPILFASGYTDDAIVRHGELEKNVNFIQKPYSLDDLARKVRDLLDAKKNFPTMIKLGALILKAARTLFAPFSTTAFQ